MAFVLTYNTLTAAVKDYLERNDAPLEASIPLFIMLGERRVARDLKILGLKIRITGNLNKNNPDSTLEKPTRWLNDSSFNIGTGTDFKTAVFLQMRSYEWCRTYWPNTTVFGQPKYYASDYTYNSWFFVPTPDEKYPCEILYYQTPTFIDQNNSQDALTSTAPEVLLYAVLLETASYLKDDERIQTWTNYYNLAKQALTDEDMRRVYDAYSKRGG